MLPPFTPTWRGGLSLADDHKGFDRAFRMAQVCPNLETFRRLVPEKGHRRYVFMRSTLALTFFRDSTADLIALDNELLVIGFTHCLMARGISPPTYKYIPRNAIQAQPAGRIDGNRWE